MRLLLAVSIALVLAGGEALAGENNEALTPTNTGGRPRDADPEVIRRVEEQMLSLNKSGDAPRDKRALGILLQGFMEALGYTVAPIQLGSLPVGPAAPAAGAMPPAQTPAAGQPTNLQQGSGAMPPPQSNPIPAPPPANGTAVAAASAPPRQRETLRFTGVLNFGNNSNTTNIIDHLSQYERIFHGNGTPQPPAGPAPSIDPRSLPPLPEPLFVKIPLPIVPNLPPPQPPSPMPVQNTYQDDYQQQNHEEAYKVSNDEEGHKSDDQEENDEGHHREEYEHSHEEYNEPEEHNNEHDDDHEEEQPEEHHEREEPKERKFEAAVSHQKPPEKNRETHYKKNQHVVNYSVENKEIRDPSEVSEEVPIVGSQYGHSMYVGEPDWKQKHEDHVYRLAAEQEAKAEALAEENAERERSHSREHEGDSGELHLAREKEIAENNERHAARYEDTSREHSNPYYDDVKEKYNNAAEQEDYEEETETRQQDAPTKAPVVIKVGVTEKPATRRYEENADKSSSQEDYQEDKSPAPALPISYDREGSAQQQPLRDSYGASLEKPDGKVDDRVAEYITMFKNPKTGVYDPSALKHYDKAREPYDRLDLASGFKKIQQEYGRPESKYEEYEINDGDDDDDGASGTHESNKADHREDSSGERHLAEGQTNGPPHTTECNCNTRKLDAHSAEAKGPEVPVTAYLPTVTPTPLAILDYGPYYSTVRHLYEPTNDQGIIASLTSYGSPTTGRLEAAPTVLALPERLTAHSLIQQSETKEITAWPAPFDYVYDNSEHKNVVLKSAPTRQTPLPIAKTTCYYETHTLPSVQHLDRVQMLIQERERDNDVKAKRKRRLQSSRDRKAEQTGQYTSGNNKVSYREAASTTQASVPKRRQTPPTTLRSESWSDKIKAPTAPSYVLEPPTAPSYRSANRATKTPAEKVKSSRQSKGNRQISRPQTTAKKKYGSYSPNLPSHNPEEKRSNYYEKNGILIIPEPTPYYYNENIEEYTDEPKSDTEKVKIKEYRNRIASVKVSKMDKLHPESSMQIYKYSTNI